MKKLITLAVIFFLIPNIVFGAFAVGFNATSTTQGWISPNRVNGVEQAILGTYFIATSTTATSTFAGGFSAASSLYVLQGGKVGIGTATPAATLHINNPTGTGTFMLQGSTNVNLQLKNGDGNVFGWQYSGSGGTALKLQYNGATKALFNSTGGLGLGTNSSTLFNMFNVAGSAAIGSTYYSQTAPTNGLIVEGNVGVGTTVPTGKLTIDAANAAVNTADTTRTLQLRVTDAMAANIGPQLGFGGPNTAGTTPYSYATIAGRKEGGAADFAGYLQFNTITAAGNLVENMRITSTGNVGIGVTSPISGRLVVSGNVANTPGISIRESDNGADAVLLYSNDTYGYIRTLLNGSVINQINSGGDSYMNGGNVGIGTTTPYSKLSTWGGAAANTRMFELVNSASTTVMAVFTNGHVLASTTAPTLSSCGTSPGINGTDRAGTVNIGATGTGCTVTFASAYGNAPSCVVTSQGGIVMTYSMTNTALTVAGATLGGTSIDYMCTVLGR